MDEEKQILTDSGPIEAAFPHFSHHDCRGGKRASLFRATSLETSPTERGFIISSEGQGHRGQGVGRGHVYCPGPACPARGLTTTTYQFGVVSPSATSFASSPGGVLSRRFFTNYISRPPVSRMEWKMDCPPSDGPVLSRSRAHQRSTLINAQRSSMLNAQRSSLNAQRSSTLNAHRLLDCSTRIYGPRWGLTGDGDVVDIIGVFVPWDNWMDVYKDNN